MRILDWFGEYITSLDFYELTIVIMLLGVVSLIAATAVFEWMDKKKSNWRK